MNRPTSFHLALALVTGASVSLLPLQANAQQANAQAVATPQSVSPSSPALPLTYYAVDQNAAFSTSLNGTWKFNLGNTDADYAKSGFDDSGWKPIQVPGNWEMQGFEEPTYKNPGDKEGFYRRTFTVPTSWQGRRVFLRFEGVGFAFEFFINGKRVGSFASSFNRSEFDVTDYVELGRPATLAVHVTRREKGWEFDTNDDWALSGIHRDVVLFSMPKTHLKDYTVTTPVSNDGKQASIRVKAWLEDFATQASQATFKANVVNARGVTVGSFTKVVNLNGAGLGVVEGEMAITTPQLWTAETPHLYRLDLEVVVAGKPVHQTTQRLGLRSTKIEAGVFKLNGKPVKFRGVNHHDMSPETGRAQTRAEYIQDLELMKAANINAIRMSHYPPQKMFLDLCDEYGMYVIDEVPFGFGEKNLTDDSYQDILALRAQATVARDKNQTSVMVWTVGNENPYTPMVVRTAGIVKALDPSRSRSIAHPTGQYYFPLPAELDILSPHYLSPRLKPDQPSKSTPFLEDVLKRPDITAPVLMTEYAHAAGTSLEYLKEAWEVMQSSDRFIGGCVWEFEDQGLYRKVPVGSYPGLPLTTDGIPVPFGKVKAGTWVAPDRVIDTGGPDGADGIVDADRFPQSDYYAVQKVYSTVHIPVESLPVKAGRQTLRIPIQNRYDFTNLSSVAGSWELRVDGIKTQGGNLKLQAAPRQVTTADLAIEIPKAPATHDQFLRFTFTDAKHRQIGQRTVRLIPDTTPTNVYQAWMTSLPKSNIKTSEQGAVVTYIAGKSRLQVNKETGEVQFGVEGQPALAFNNLALRVGRTPQMSEDRAYKGAFWNPYLLTKPLVKAINTSALSNGQIKADVTLLFTRISSDPTKGNVSDQGFTAQIHLTLSRQGWLDVDYELSPINASDYLLELGLAFQMPGTSTRLTWLGKGPYAVYPIQGEGMERGVYTVAPGKDFDPVNRIYGGDRTEVDLASATDDKGNGLGVMCQSATVSLEPQGGSAFFSHILRSAGHGGKRTFSDVNIKASDLKPLSGSLRLLPLVAGQWPTPFKTVLGNPEASPRMVAVPTRK